MTQVTGGNETSVEDGKQDGEEWKPASGGRRDTEDNRANGL